MEFKDCFNNTKEISFKNITLKIGKITLRDLVSFQNYFSDKRKKELIELYKLTEQKVNIKELDTLSADASYLNEKMSSVEGILYLFKLVVQKHNPNLDIDALIDSLSVEDIETISSLISENLSAPETKGEQEGDKNFPQTSN